MSERFSRLFSLPENLYAISAPVVIVAGALLKDNQTRKVLAQLKLKNIGAKAIKAASVSIQPLDTVGNSLCDKITYQYLDLNIYRSGEFGTKTPIVLPNASTRSYTVSVTEVIFADNTVWKIGDGSWEALNAPATLEHFLKDHELVKQYRIKFGTDCKYEPAVQKDLWYCACGELNRKEDTMCHYCRKVASTLLPVDLNTLKKECDARVAAEQQKAAEEKAAADINAKKIKKMAMIIIPIVVVLIVAAVLISNIVKKNQEEAARLEAYNVAITYMESEQYDKAINAFVELGEYRDSIQQAEKARNAKANAEAYAAAEDLLKNGQYAQAVAGFEALGSYRDSEQQCNIAKELMAEEEARNASISNAMDNANTAFSKNRDIEQALSFIDEALSYAQEDQQEEILATRNAYIKKAYYSESHFIAMSYILDSNSSLTTMSTSEKLFTHYQHFYMQGEDTMWTDADRFINDYFVNRYNAKTYSAKRTDDIITVWFDDENHALIIEKDIGVPYAGLFYKGSQLERTKNAQVVHVYIMSAADVAEYIQKYT